MRIATLVEIERLGEAEMMDLTWRLLQERPPEANISHKQMPTREEHEGFVRHHPYQVWYAIIDEEGMFAGTVLLTWHNEIGIAILKEHQRKGYARAAINMLRMYRRAAKPSEIPAKIVANVAPGNAASHALFKSMGGKQIQVTYELP